MQASRAKYRSAPAGFFQKKTPEKTLRCWIDGPILIKNGGYAVCLSSECTENNRADKSKGGAHDKRIESQGQVHL